MAETVISLQLGEACWLTIQLVPEYDRSFEYDLVGNAIGGSRGPAEFYSNFLTGNGSSTFVADPDGFGETIKEITGDKVKNYVYRSDGKISAFQSGNLSVNYFYDGLDRLVAQQVNENGTPFTNSFVHLGDENRILLGKAGDGTATTYINGQGPNESLGEVRNGVGKGYITDHSESVLNSPAAGSWKTYGLMGEVSVNVTVSPTMSPVVYAWQGLRYDPLTGQYDNYARRYNQNTGTFTSQDPIGVVSGEINYYSSRFNNPLVFVDHPGRAACSMSDGASAVNGGCGSGWNDPIVPDQPLGNDFRLSCYVHDQCYGSDQTKNSCDTEFRKDLFRSCNGDRGCENLADTYVDTVELVGGSAYNEAQRKRRKIK